MDKIWDLIVLFFASFVAATLLPAQSELVLASLSYRGYYDKITLLMVATFGNVLGSWINWIMGAYLIKFKNRRWFPVKEKSIKKYSKIYDKWGVWSLLFAWLPIVGDPLTVIAGIFKTNIWLFILLVTIGKLSRYAVILYIFYK
jgi:membrane protein YqaA with SNARE-associated domain